MRERPHSKSMCNCSSWSPLSYDSSEGTDKLLKQMSPTPATLASLPNIGAQLKKKSITTIITNVTILKEFALKLWFHSPSYTLHHNKMPTALQYTAWLLLFRSSTRNFHNKMALHIQHDNKITCEIKKMLSWWRFMKIKQLKNDAYVKVTTAVPPMATWQSIWQWSKTHGRCVEALSSYLQFMCQKLFNKLHFRK